MNRMMALGFIAALSIGCGGPSDDATLSGLSDDEIEDLCADSTTESKDCGSGVTVTSNNSAECASAIKGLPDNCTATVGDYNTCEAEELCARPNNAACGKMISCALQ